MDRTGRTRQTISRTILILASVCAILTGFVRGKAYAQNAGAVVRVPLTIDYLTLSEALKHEVYVEPGGRANLWQGSNRCQYLVAEHPRFSRGGKSQIRLETDAQLSLGMPIGDTCVSPLSWKGIIEAKATPYIAPGMMLRFHVTDVNLYDEEHKKTLIVGHGFDLIKRYFIPRFEGFSFDLNPVTHQLVSLTEEAAPPAVAQRVRDALATIRAEPTIGMDANGIKPVLAITVPFVPTPVPGPTPGAAPLTPAELAAFQKTLDQWDTFLVFAIKQLGGTAHDPVLRDQLFQLLLDSRYRLLQALQNPTSGGPDPVRILFLREWRTLGKIIRGAAARGTLGNRSLEFLSFISAGDALFALDKAAPTLGMRISAADLRRLARIVAPGVKTDPLAFSYREDPELRKMFGFKTEPLSETPAASPGAVTPSASPSAGPSPFPSPSPRASTTPRLTPAPRPRPTPAKSPAPTMSPAPASTGSATPSAVVSPTPAPTVSPGPATTSWLDLPMRMLSPRAACAAEPVSHASGERLSGDLRALGVKLRRAVVNDDNAKVYRERMGELLSLSAQRTIRDKRVDARQRAMYARLMKSVAWQESCWRQFVLRNGRVRWLESSSGDIGLMQVNKRVWRGFYNIRLLEWDVVYNAGAGSEILAHLLADITRSRRIKAGDNDALARSTYAAYNGGPSDYLRWLGHESPLERLIDRSFWRKYHAVSRGQEIDILTCSAQWGKTPGH